MKTMEKLQYTILHRDFRFSMITEFIRFGIFLNTILADQIGYVSNGSI